MDGGSNSPAVVRWFGASPVFDSLLRTMGARLDRSRRLLPIAASDGPTLATVASHSVSQPGFNVASASASVTRAKARSCRLKGTGASTPLTAFPTHTIICLTHKWREEAGER